MSTAKVVSKNFTVLLLGNVITTVLSVVYMGVLARYIGADGIGQISTATALMSILILGVDFGLGTLIVRDVAADLSRASRYLAHALILRGILSLGLVVILIGLLSQSIYTYETKLVIVLYAVVYICDSLSEAARAIFHAFQKMEYEVYVEVTRALVNITLSLAAIWLGWSLIAIVAVSSLASAVKMGLSLWAVTHRFARPTWVFDRKLAHYLVTAAVPFILILGVGVLYSKFNVLILSWIDDAAEVGFYSSACFPIFTLLVLPRLFMDSIFPVLSQHYSSAEHALARSYATSYKVMIAVGFPVGIGSMVIAQPIIRAIYGPGFEDAVIVMQILAVQLVTMVGYVNGALLNAIGRQKLFAGLRIIGLVLNLALCVVLIPAYGAVGAALALTIPAVIDFGLYTGICYHLLALDFPWGLWLRCGISAAIMGLVSRYALEQSVNVVLVVIGPGMVLYGTLIVILGVVNAEEWSLLENLVRLDRWRTRWVNLHGDHTG